MCDSDYLVVFIDRDSQRHFKSKDEIEKCAINESENTSKCIRKIQQMDDGKSMKKADFAKRKK